MTFSLFAQHLQELEVTGSRITMTQLLAKLYQKLDQQELVIANYLLQGVLLPAYESLEFQLSIKMAIRAMARMKQTANSPATSPDLFGNEDELVTAKEVMMLYSRLGDLGLVAEQVRQQNSIAPQNLSLSEVYHALWQLLRRVAVVRKIGS